MSAEEFLGLLPNDLGLALVACSPALRLEDGLALRLIDRVISTAGAQPQGHSVALLRGVKRLNCVRHQWDGTWSVAADVRPALVAHLEGRLNREHVAELRALAAHHAEERLQHFLPDGQITASNFLQTRFEVAFQRTLVPETSASGAKLLGDLWQEEGEIARSATAESVDYLAPEIEREVAHVPPEVSFLRGKAAKQRGDVDGQIRHFGAVWRQGRPGELFAIAAHMFGLLIRDRRVAEQALRDSLAWDRSVYTQAVVLASLGNLLAKDEGRWEEAEEVFNASLESCEAAGIATAPTWHSLGNLLAKWHRGRDAEQCYRRALETSPPDAFRAEVLASFAFLLSHWPERYEEAIHLARESLSLDLVDPGPSYRVLAYIYNAVGKLSDALHALKALANNDRRLGRMNFARKTQSQIRELERRLRQQRRQRRRDYD
jgi:tetratricopeptide (TPR) repeat protein